MSTSASRAGAAHSCSPATRWTTQAASAAANASGSARRPSWQRPQGSAGVVSFLVARGEEGRGVQGDVFAELVACLDLGTRP
jgi:hypothetical protein